MNNVKKVIVILVVVLFAFFAGFYTGSRIRSAKLEARISDSERRAEELAESNRRLTEELNNANIRIGELAEESNRLTEQNREYAESIGNISGGIGEVAIGLEGIERAIDFYLNQVKE